MDKTRESTDADIEALIDVKAAEVEAHVRAVQGNDVTSDQFALGILFEAAWARIQLELCLRAAQNSMQLNRDLLTLADKMKIQLETERGKPTKAVRAMTKELDALRDSIETAESVLLPIARRGARFVDSKRGVNRLSLKALDVLKNKGWDYPAKLVLRELERAGVICENATGLHWEDDKGNQKTTTTKQFENNISRLRKRLK